MNAKLDRILALLEPKATEAKESISEPKELKAPKTKKVTKKSTPTKK